MKRPCILVLVLAAGPALADLSYDVEQSTIANPILGLKSKKSVAHVMVKGSGVAIRENDIVQIVNGELNLITLIDFRTQTFATSNLDELKRADDQGFDSIQGAMRSELVQSGEPAVWQGIAVKRDVLRMVIEGGELAGEVLATSDWVEDIPAFAESRTALEAGEDRHAQELEAEIQSLIFAHPERFADSLKIRKTAAGHNGFQIHSRTEMRLAADSPLRKAIGPENADRPLMSEETQVMNIVAGEVDPAVFLVPPEFRQVEFQELLAQKYTRRHY